MTITLDISTDLESRLREEAAKQGIELGQLVAEAVRTRLQSKSSNAPCLDADQSRLLGEINQGLSQSEWDRYYALVEKRRSGELTEDDHTELTATSNRIEHLNARRIECLAELARLRKTTLSALLDELGIAPPPVI